MFQLSAAMYSGSLLHRKAERRVNKARESGPARSVLDRHVVMIGMVLEIKIQS